MPQPSSRQVPPASPSWAGVRMFGIFCVTAGLTVENAADAFERGGAFPWLKVALALLAVWLAADQGRRLRAALGARPTSPITRGPESSARAG